jgi:hypothetical protein
MLNISKIARYFNNIVFVLPIARIKRKQEREKLPSKKNY